MVQHNSASRRNRLEGGKFGDLGGNGRQAVVGQLQTPGAGAAHMHPQHARSTHTQECDKSTLTQSWERHPAVWLCTMVGAYAQPRPLSRAHKDTAGHGRARQGTAPTWTTARTHDRGRGVSHLRQHPEVGQHARDPNQVVVGEIQRAAPAHAHRRTTPKHGS